VQTIILRKFNFDCMKKTTAADAPNVIYRNGAITDPDCKADYERRLAAMRKDQPTLAILAYFMREETSHLGPSRADFLKTCVDRSGWIELTMLPLLILLLQQKEISSQTAESYVSAQIALIEAGMNEPLREKNRDKMMAHYLDTYRHMFDDAGRFKPIFAEQSKPAA
jgi:hypothetical protein